jgi:hypothetical protein
VRVETLLSESASKPKSSPVHLLLDAFNTSSEGDVSGHVGLWNALKTAATETASKSSESSTQEGPQFGRVFVDETIQLLASMSPDSIVMSPVLEIASPVPRRSSPFSKILDRGKDKAANGNGQLSPTSPVVSDWAQFSSSGFGETSAATPLAATLLDDKDLEITEPTPKSGRKWGRSRSRQRSADSPRDTSAKEPAIISTKLASVHVTQVDEAFIDFWSDAITDPITENWPSFVICGLKPLPTAAAEAEAVNWLIVEQTYVRQQRAQPRTASPERRGRTSPRPSFRSDISGTFAATRKRLSFFSGGSKTSLTGKKSVFVKSPKVGELGEILPEEEESPTVRTKKGHGLGVAAAGGARAAETVRLPATSSSQLNIAGEPAVPTAQEPVVEGTIPPAPTNVVLAGDTPGPQVALETSEPAALVAASAASEPEASHDRKSISQATLVEESVSQPEPEVSESASDADEEEAIFETPAASSLNHALPAIPVVDTLPELPVAPVEQLPIVAEMPVGEDVAEEVEGAEAVTFAPVSQADEAAHSHEAAPEVIEAAEPEVPVQAVILAHDQSPATASKPAEETNGAMIPIESSPSTDAQDEADVPL